MKNKSLRGSISVVTIRKANNRLIHNGVTFDGDNSYSGEIKVELSRGTLNHKRTISKEQIDSAFKKSLQEYAEKV